MKRNLYSIQTERGRVAYRKSGSAQGPALFLVHGAVGDSRLFRNQLKHFGDRYTVIAIDLPGHGSSYNGAVPSMDDFVDAVRAVAREERLESLVLFGHSMGGCVCFEILKRNAVRVEGLVLISTAPVLPVSKELVRIANGDSMEPLADLLISSVFTEKVDLLASFARKGLAEMDREIIKNDIHLCDRMDYADSMAHISVPTLIVGNSKDAVIPINVTAAMVNSIPGSRLEIFDAAGHVPFFERGDSFNRITDEFLSSIRPAGDDGGEDALTMNA